MDSRLLTSKDPGLFALDALIRTVATRKINTVAVKCLHHEIRYEYIGLDLYTYEGFINENYLDHLPSLLSSIARSDAALIRFIDNQYYSIKISGNTEQNLFYLDLTAINSAMPPSAAKPHANQS